MKQYIIPKGGEGKYISNTINDRVEVVLGTKVIVDDKDKYSRKVMEVVVRVQFNMIMINLKII